MSQKIHLLTVGKLKDSSIASLEQSYLVRLKELKPQFHEVKQFAEDRLKEGDALSLKIEEILKNHPTRVILLSEWGKTYTTSELHNFFQKSRNSDNRDLLFVIGGSTGFSEDILKQFPEKISLSPLTFPHQFARLLFIEQLYRIQTIMNNHPYHH